MYALRVTRHVLTIRSEKQRDVRALVGVLRLPRPFDLRFAFRTFDRMFENKKDVGYAFSLFASLDEFIRRNFESPKS